MQRQQGTQQDMQQRDTAAARYSGSNVHRQQGAQQDTQQQDEVQRQQGTSTAAARYLADAAARYTAGYATARVKKEGWQRVEG